jgi:hypothetical protein
MTAPKIPGHTPRPTRKTADLYDSESLDRIAPASDKARKAADVALRKVFAERMYKARVDINGWSQLHASKMLGFSNSSPLAKIEMGEAFSRTMPAIAARVYKVSTDYLLGISDFDFECRTPGTEWESAIVNANTAFFQAAISGHAKALARIGRTTSVTVDGLAKVMAATGSVKEVFERVIELNPHIWAECRGGSRLESVMQELERVCQDVHRTAARARVDLQNQGYAAGITELIDGRLDAVGSQEAVH